jgi:hypothetical protein
VSSELDLKKWVRKLEDKDVTHSVFREPDIGNEITSLSAVTDDERLFRSLRLLYGSTSGR